MCGSEFIVRPVPTDVSALGVADNRTMTVVSLGSSVRGVSTSGVFVAALSLDLCVLNSCRFLMV